uniref:Uncharacterized protein n=1 Tax=Nymphaea colorata TaxID=210225 RepID=A0A5K1C0P5_9MAGN
MEEHHSPHGEEGLVKFNSCWGRVRGRLKRWWRLTRKLRRRRPCCRTKPGSFRYDPLSYSQNFDEGTWEMDEEEHQCRGYMARFALPITKPAGQ